MSADFSSARFGRLASPPERSAGPAWRSAAAVMVCLLVLTGCRLGLVAEAVVSADDGGSVAVTTAFDAELLDRLDALGVDPTAELEAVAASTTGWETVRVLREEGGLEVVATRGVADAADIGDAFRELSAGLTDTDPALLIDIEVTTDEQGRTGVAGSARLRPPRTAGVGLDGAELGPDARELEAIVASSVDAQLRIELPGRVVDHDGDRTERRTVVWSLPAGEQVGIRAEADAPRWWMMLADRWSQLPAAALIALGVVLLLLAVGGLLWRRSRTGAPT